jgi:hypothetical protein
VWNPPFSILKAFLISFLFTAILSATETSSPDRSLYRSPGDATYRIDPVHGDDANPPDKAWRTFGKLNSVQLAPGDRVLVSPGRQNESLVPSGAGTAEKPVVIQFLPGIHTLSKENVTRLPIFVSNSMDSTATKPVGILIRNFKHLRLTGGGVEGKEKTTILHDGRVVQIWNDQSEDVTFSGLVFDLKRPTVSEFRVLETGAAFAVIQVAEGSDYEVKDGKFLWRGDWGPGSFGQILSLDDGRCRRARAPRGWNESGQTEAKASDLGDRKIRLDYPDGESGLKPRHQYHFRNITRDSVGVHTSRCRNIVFRDCHFHALTGMGFVSQFTENMTFQRVHVAPPADSIRTCTAWGDIFQFSNCKGALLVDSCRLSGMQDDAINCHGTFLRIVEKPAEKQLLVRFMHRQTFGFAPYVPGDEVAVVDHKSIREYPGNPRRIVTAVERKSDTDWLLTLDGPCPAFAENDVLDNITWQPDLTARDNHVSVNPVRGFLLTTRGKVVVENNVFQRCNMAAILISADAASWFESSPVRDVLIRGNTFVDCGISIDPHVQSTRPDAPVHENIRILDNHFDGAGVSAKSVRGLTIKGNRSSGADLSIRLDPSCTETEVGDNESVKK